MRIFTVLLFLASAVSASEGGSDFRDSPFFHAISEHHLVEVAAPTIDGLRTTPTDGIPVLETVWYRVCWDGDEVRIASDECERHRMPVTFEVNGFRYQGTNRGEWGGGLTVQRPDGSTETLIESNVVAVFPYRPFHIDLEATTLSWVQASQKLYVFTGLAHMGRSDGAIYEISGIDTNPQVRLVTLLPDAPEIVLEGENPNGQLLFIAIGYGSVMLYDPNSERFAVPLVNQAWRFRTPISAISWSKLSRNEVLVGFRNFVAWIEIIYTDADVRIYSKHGSN